MHAAVVRRSTDPRITKMPGRRASGFHRPSGHCEHTLDESVAHSAVGVASQPTVGVGVVEVGVAVVESSHGRGCSCRGRGCSWNPLTINVSD